jgi:hypothetical protein
MSTSKIQTALAGSSIAPMKLSKSVDIRVEEADPRDGD